MVSATKKITLLDVPQVLVIQLKRFTFTQCSMFGPSKVNNSVTFKRYVQLNEFMADKQRAKLAEEGKDLVADLHAVVVHQVCSGGVYSWYRVWVLISTGVLPICTNLSQPSHRRERFNTSALAINRIEGRVVKLPNIYRVVTSPSYSVALNTNTFECSVRAVQCCKGPYIHENP